MDDIGFTSTNFIDFEPRLGCQVYDTYRLIFKHVNGY
jgi:hypothetical protein